MPRRDPLSPPLLTASAALAAFVGGWIALLTHALFRGALGALVGFPWHGITVSRLGVPCADQALPAGADPGRWAVMLLAGPLGAAVIALLGHHAVEAVRSPAWLRTVALEWLAFAVLRVPALLAAAALPGGQGEFAELYRRLGEPASGRWAVTFLGLLALWAGARVVALRTTAVGRSWMRVDGLEFRRRLVRVLAAYPVLIALAAFSLERPWAPLGWEVAWLATTLLALMVRVS